MAEVKEDMVADKAVMEVADKRGTLQEEILEDTQNHLVGARKLEVKENSSVIVVTVHINPSFLLVYI